MQRLVLEAGRKQCNMMSDFNARATAVLFLFGNECVLRMVHRSEWIEGPGVEERTDPIDQVRLLRAKYLIG